MCVRLTILKGFHCQATVVKLDVVKDSICLVQADQDMVLLKA